MIFQTFMILFHVNLQGCNCYLCDSNQKLPPTKRTRQLGSWSTPQSSAAQSCCLKSTCAGVGEFHGGSKHDRMVAKKCECPKNSCLEMYVAHVFGGAKAVNRIEENQFHSHHWHGFLCIHLVPAVSLVHKLNTWSWEPKAASLTQMMRSLWK